MHLKKLTLMIAVFIISLLTIHTASAATQQFEDIPLKHSAYEEIDFLVNKNVIGGYTINGKKYFKPNNEVTRGQAAKMLVNATGKKGLEVNTSSFDDIKTTQEVSLYAERAYSLAWFQYTSGKNFSPNMVVSRQEMAKIISKAYNLDTESFAELELPFKDVPKSSMYYKYVAAVYYNGIAKGTTDTTFSLTSGVTRSQFALFVARATSDKYRLDLPIQGISVPDSAKALGEITITTNGLNIRSTSDFTGTVNNKVGVANNGDTFKYYEATSSYYKINFNGEYAYVYKTYAKVVDEDQEKPSEEPKPVDSGTSTSSVIGIATVNDLVVRTAADGSSTKLGSINRGTQLPVHKVTGNWAQVTYNGKTGYVHKTYLRLKNNSGSAVKDRIIVIDPGHGGTDPGAVSNGAQEKQVVLAVSQKLKTMLEAKGAKVYMSRSGDTYPTLENRVAYAREKNGEMFISIHANAASASASGTETFYSISNNANALEDKVLAQYINEEIVKNANMKDRDVKQADYYVIKNLTMPAVLVELGFITNASDRDKLIATKYQEIYAQSIYNGIMRYYSR